MNAAEQIPDHLPAIEPLVGLGVDVLAVLDDFVAVIESEGVIERFPLSANDLRQVRTDLAELVEALTAERVVRNSEVKPPEDIERAAYDRTAAALARVSGGAK